MLEAIPVGLAMSDIGSVLYKLQTLAARLPAAERGILTDLLRAAGVAPTTPTQYNPFLPHVHGDPYTHYQQLQTDNPVHWSYAIQSWVVSRYDDVAAALRNSRLSSQTAATALAATVPELERDTVRTASAFAVSLLNELDPPQHTHMRRLMTRALAASASTKHLPDVGTAAHTLLDSVEMLGHMDVVSDYAYPLPAIVAADLLGIPVAERDNFARSVRDTVHTFSNGFTCAPAMRRGEEAVTWLIEYLHELLSRHRVEQKNDVMTALISANDATDHERILVAANIALGLHESVTHAIGLLTRTLLCHPDVLSAASDTPELLPAVVEEAFRYEGTAPIISRLTKADIAIGGVMIPAGQPVALLIAAANRDADRFDHPQTFDPHRIDHHLAFGVGRHACPGTSLAHELVLVAIRTLLNRFTAIKLTEASPTWREEVNIHGLVTLPISFRPRVHSTRRLHSCRSGEAALDVTHANDIR